MKATKLLLCTDLDRTLLPNGPQAESPQARPLFTALVERAEVALVYVTGRDQDLVKQAIAEYRLPQPDYVIADVGSSIYANITQQYAASWQPLRAWHERIANDWNGISGPEISTLLRAIPLLRLQEDTKQGLFKLSYYVPQDADKSMLLAMLNNLLQKQQIRANLIWSIDEPAGVALLDILPASATKYHALIFLMQQTGHSLETTLFAGDSGNDLDVLCSEISSVLVANASAEVAQEAHNRATELGNLQRLYRAKGGLFGLNGNYSAGIIEGFVHFFPQRQHWLATK